ncbi:acylneuraminate cytidylyltransferase family protein [Flavobacterium sp. W22_SRS_FP1]|uniref:acylneuraminate cytidylyltransferase family protein n=1 Tax=Flavobacterium sp. W22_SRS_FP1 TaxID=3240276 RepID=UPI003F91C5F9
MKTIAIIPARGNSKRLPNKNLLLLGGIPLLAHSILFAQRNLSIIDEIYVTTDNAAIKEVALQYGARVIDRPDSLSGDFEPTISCVQHALDGISEAVESVVLLQPSSPLRPEKLLQEAFQSYHSSDADSLFTVTRNHQKLGKIENNCFEPYNYTIGQRSQDLETLYYENGLLYVTKANLIREGIIVSENSIPYEVNHIFATVDIDTQDDFDYAAFLYQKLITHNS